MQSRAGLMYSTCSAEVPVNPVIPRLPSTAPSSCYSRLNRKPGATFYLPTSFTMRLKSRLGSLVSVLVRRLACIPQHHALRQVCVGGVADSSWTTPIPCMPSAS